MRARRAPSARGLHVAAWLVLPPATLAWLVVAVVLWTIARTIPRLHRANPPGESQGEQEIRAAF